MKHAPRHKYDCGRCKFSWCCGPCCGCLLREAARPPRERALEVVDSLTTWRRSRGYEPTLDEQEKRKLGL
jgi:hypothetical protein